ncbi:hypothetical protein F383_11145 [Gossypium arboreum]|uniref:Uncharacterized protein n=1 Tax=Gossypium arboreum TaxID=29729 RepID=A0A0B0NE88_GOSAR|nr:hypothetical protein F383_11145 [Gossypium arboreum]
MEREKKGILVLFIE